MSLQNESKYITAEWLWNDESNQTVWIYCEGVDDGKELHLELSFSQQHSHYDYGHYCINDKYYRIDASINNGWNEVELRYSRKACG